MSRRKQHRPRHLDSDRDLAAILNTGNQTEPSMTSQSEGGDAHVCGKCRAEFLGLTDFLAHKKTCSRKRIVVMYDDEDKTLNSEDMDGPPPLKAMSNGDLDHIDNEMVDGEEDCAPHLENEVESRPFETVEDSEDKTISQVVYPELESGEDDNMGDEDEDEEEEEEEEEEGMDMDITESAEKSSQVIPGQMPPMMPLGGMPFFPDPHVKLEALDSTKVAVAQFAENNIAPSDLAILQSTLYSLQQQQLMQLQLLQQLQAQLMAGVTPSLATLQAMLPPGMHPLPLSLMNSMIPPPAPGPKSESKTDAKDSVPSMMPPASPPAKPCDDKTKISSSESSKEEEKPHTTSLVPPSTQAPTSVADSRLFFQKVENLLPKTQPFLGVDLGKPPSLTASNLDRSQYCAEDPFFKHKCRFCHKVFGSDSALQIHIRSHTGERPFKCNICGNRFSTRGNLKVHFTRHKAKYPHVKMNPNPVPEHLDRPNAPVLVAPIPQMQGVAPESNSPVIPPPKPTPKPEEKPAAVPPPSVSSEGAQIEKSSSPGANIASSEPSPSQPAISESLLRAPSTGSSAPSISSAPSTPGVTKEPPVSINISQGIPFSSTIMPPTFSSPSLSMGGPLMHGARFPLPPGLASPAHPGMPSFGLPEPPFFRPSILPPKEEDPMEQFMEIDKSETSKLQALVENIETKLTDPNQCAICHRILSCKSALQMHYRTHTGERPFKCKICGRAFTTKGNLKTHMGVHRAKPPMRMMHQCPVCHKQFTNSLVLQQHIRMHTGEIPKDMPLPPEMMPPHGFIPFPGFPVMPPMGFLPGMHPPGAPPLRPPSSGGELDLRKHHTDKKPNETKEIKSEMDESDQHSQRDGDSIGDQPGLEGIPEEIVKEVGESDYDSDQYDDDNIEDDEMNLDMEEASGDQDEPPKLDSELAATPTSNGDKDREMIPVTSFAESIKSDMPLMSPYLPPKLPENPFRPHTEYLSTSMPSVITSMGYPLPPTSSYSTSLMALEERVKAIDTTSPLSQYSQRPLEGMANILRRTESQMSPPGNGLQNGLPSPRTSPAMGGTDAGIDGRNSPNSHKEDSRSSNGASPSANSDSNASHDGRFEGMDGMFPFRGLGALDLSPISSELGRHNTTCNICFKTFACKSALDIHYRSHTKERPFKCDMCDRGFSTRGNMKQHQLTHKIRDMPNKSMDSNESGSQSSGEFGGSQSGDQPKPPTSSTASSPGSCSSRPVTEPTTQSVHVPLNVPLPGTPGGLFSGLPGGLLSRPPSGFMGVPLGFGGPLGMGGPLGVGKPLGMGGSTSDVHKQSPPSLSSPEDKNKPMVPTSTPGKTVVPPTTPSKPIVPMSSSGSTTPTQPPSDSSPFLKRHNPKHMCLVCTKPFSSASALQIHMRTHTGDKPFKCTVCGKAFTTKGNLKVHMGTHMWNNSPSRRGRRMSVDTLPPGFPSPKDAEFFNSFAHRPPPEMFPFPPFPGFHNGFSPKMNEISVIQSINGNISHLPPSSNAPTLMTAHLPPSMVETIKPRPPAPPPAPPKPVPSEPVIKMDMSPSNDSKVKVENNNNNNTPSHLSGSSGELDLSMRKSPGLMSPPRAESPHNPTWVWKTTCHLCNKVCSSVSALELHMKGHMQRPEESSPKPLMT